MSRAKCKHFELKNVNLFLRTLSTEMRTSEFSPYTDLCIVPFITVVQLNE